MALLVDVISYKDSYKFENKIRNNLKKALQYLNKKDVLVEVALVSNEEMVKISKQSRNKEQLTTVLSFEDNNFPGLKDDFYRLGEIYLAPDFIKDKNMNLIEVAIHGLLHLLGYTHKNENDTMKMEALEGDIFQYLKLN